MRTMLVAPGVPSGTPATMMTRCPALAKPSLKAIRQARSTMSSWSCASSATTQCTPHTAARSEEHTSELQSQSNLVCRLLLEKKKKNKNNFSVLNKKKNKKEE